MYHRGLVGGLALLVIAALPLAGCGDGNNDNIVIGANCGDGHIDSGEQCDGNALGGKTCATQGFSSGTLECTTSCTLDTSGCVGTSRTPTPVVTATPIAQVTATATVVEGATATPVNPTPTATPGGPTCSDGQSIVVTVSLDTDITSARVDLGYPTSANIPGSGLDQSVKDRVVFKTQSGLQVKNDFDASGDSVDDTITMSLVSTDTTLAGLFATITFDCVAGDPEPGVGDFVCTVVSASQSGASVTPGCTVAIQ